MKYEFIVHPGADPDVIKMSYTGIEGLSIDESGNLIIHTALGDVNDEKPYCYQDIDGKRVEVAAGFKILDSEPSIPEARIAGPLTPSAIRTLDTANETNPQVQQFIYGFGVESYNPNYPLIIDPGLQYSTFLGGSSDDSGNAIAVDSSGRVYVTGSTWSSGFPTTPGAFDVSHNGFDDAFVTKLNSTGTALSYSTFLGGRSYDGGYGIAVDSSGSAYVTGYTRSANFPTTSGMSKRILTKRFYTGCTTGPSPTSTASWARTLVPEVTDIIANVFFFWVFCLLPHPLLHPCLNHIFNPIIQLR